MAASEQCETGEVERDYLQLELAKARTRNTELEEKALDTQVVERYMYMYCVHVLC